MSKESRQHEKNLQFYCDNHLFLKSKIALLTVYDQQSSKWTEKGLLLYEYAQLMSQGLLIYSSLVDPTTQSLFEKAILYFFKIINPSYLLDFNGFSSLTWKIIILMLVFTCLKLILGIYVVFQAHWNFQGPKLLLEIWRWLFKFQTRVICYLVTSFWVNAITNLSNPGFQPENISKTFIIVIFGLLIALEYFASFLIETQFCDILPRKDYLSAKNNEMQLITLTQKLVLQLLQLLRQNSSLGTFWLFSVFNLLLSAFRIQRFYTQLPLYQRKALFMLGNLVNIVMALHIASTIGVITLSRGSSIQVTPLLIIILWVFTGLFLFQMNHSLLSHVTLKLISSHRKFQPALLLSKVIFSKKLEKNEKLPGDLANNFHPTHLLKMSETANFLKKYSATRSSHEEYLVDLLTENQKDPRIKLYLAKIWLKKFGICSKALVFIKEVIKKPWSREYTSALFLLQTIQQTYLASAKNEENDFDFIDYIENQRLFSDLKDEMAKQAELKISICKNILGDTANIGEIYHNSQLVQKSKRRIQRKIDAFLNDAPDFWLAPLLICSNYYLVLEYSSTKCQKYQEMYQQKYIKYDKYFSSSSLNKENIYQEENVFFIMGGQKSENGLVKYCSKSVENVFGGEKPNYISSHISTLFMPSMQPVYKEFFQRALDEGDSSLSQKVHQTFLYNKSGYMFEANFCLWLHPYITENPYLDMVIRPVRSSNEYFLVKENGDIEGATKKICKALGMTSGFLPSSPVTINLKSISEELFNANQAFNLLSKKESQTMGNSSQKSLSSSQTLDPKEFKRALELFNIFSAGKEVSLLPYTTDSLSKDGIPYHCKIIKISSELPFLKLIVLSKLFKGGGDQFFGEEKDISNDIDYDEPQPMTTTMADEKNNFFLTCMSPKASERNLLFAPLTLGGDLLTAPPINISPKRKLILQNNFSDFRNKNTESIEKNNELHDYISNTTASLKNSEEKRTYKALKSALGKKTHSHFFKFLCFSFYVIVALTLASQILLKHISDQTMEDLVIKKDLLNSAQIRSYYACKMPFSIEASYLLSIGIDVYGYLTGVSLSPFAILGVLTSYYNELATANKKIMNLLGSLDDPDLHSQVYSKNIRFFGSVYDPNDESVFYLTSFQAVEQLGTPVRHLNTLTDPIAPSTMAAYRYIRTNSLNDFLAENIAITSTFQDSVNNQRYYLKFFISLCLAITPLLLTGVALFLTFIIWRQYSKEKNYLKAFIKLHPTSVHFVLENISSFKKALVDDSSFEEKRLIEFFWNQSTVLEELRINNHHAKHESQKINCKQTKKKYFLFVLQMAVYIAILIGVLLWNFLSAQNSLDVIYHKQSQLQLSNHISERVTIDMIGMVEMFISNNTLNVSQMSALDLTIAAIADIEHLNTQVLTGFSNIDGTYDPLLKKIVFDGEDCSVYGGFNTNYCIFLNSHGILTNIASLMSFFENLIESQLNIYENMNKNSLLDLTVALYLRGSIISSAASLLAFEAQRLNGIIDQQLTELIDDANRKQNRIIIVFVATILAVSFLIWIQILSKLKELNNDFKNVLQVLPPKLVLSSFLLKQFLNKISVNIFEI